MYNKTDRLSERIYSFMDRFLRLGVRPDMTVEQEREQSNSNLLFFLMVILGLIMLFDIIHFNLYRYLFIAIGTIFCAIGGMIYSARTGHSFLPRLILVAGLSAFFLRLVATGGATNTGFIWLFVFPLLHFFAFSFRVGMALFLSVLTGLAILFFYPGRPFLTAPYSDVMRQRIFIAYFFVGCAAIASEFVQWRAQQRINALMTKLVELSRIDQLTGLYNRRAFLERVEYEQKRSTRGNHSMSLIMLDIDHFKAINDQRGHNCGDLALKDMANFISSHIRQQDTVARWGGEEFIILLPDTNVAGGGTLAETLRSGAEKLLLEYNGETFSLTISLGVCQYHLSIDPNENIGCVDSALYEAKRLGRNQVCVHDQSRS